MTLGFFAMALSPNIIAFTISYFFGVLGISLCFTTLGALTSRAVDERNQGEVMGMMTWVESFISIGIPILATYIYTQIEFSFFFIVAVLPLTALIINRIFFSCTEFRVKK